MVIVHTEAMGDYYFINDYADFICLKANRRTNTSAIITS